METSKKQSSKFSLKYYISKILIGASTVLILLLSSLGVIMIDNKNYLREKYLNFIDDKKAYELLEIFGIEMIKIHKAFWILFLIIIFFVFALFVASFIKDLFLSRGFNSKKVKSTYYISILVFTVVLIGLSFALGAFDRFDESLNILSDILLIIFICSIFIALILVALIACFYIIKLAIVMATGVSNSNRASKNKSLENKKDYNNYGEFKDYSAEKVFPALVRIDEKGEEPKTQNTSISLDELALQFQSYAANEHKIYYGLPLIRSFFAGLGASRLIILEGLSGTGKSMLPRMFSEFTGSKAFFAPVQATWRDKTDVLGFYSEFAKTFKSTQFLENLYHASYIDKVNLMILDEMNLSRIEYYFADFLSVMEYPPEDWKIRVSEVQAGQTLPKKLEDGCITVPTNTWFIGTANTDDSTFTITDKVYDRAIVIDFEEKTTPIESDYKKDKINISAEKLSELFENAKNDEEKRLNKEETEKFLTVCDFMKEAFNVSFGNRIMTQIESFIPIYVALGGTKEEGLDFLFARKILRKVDGMFEDFVKEELVNLSNLLTKLYGENTFKETEKLITRFSKRLV